MKIAIHQPQYMPWLGYFDKIDLADVFVVLDDVQYKKNEWQNRNKIRNAVSWQWLTVPVKYEFGRTIKEVKVDDSKKWREKHVKSLEMSYSRAPFFGRYFPRIRDIIFSPTDSLADISTELIEYFMKELGLDRKTVRSSSLQVASSSTERLVEICRKMGADAYISGAGGSEYLDEGVFEAAGIGLEYQQFSHPAYEQVFSGFEPGMAAVDILFSKGDESMEIIRSGRKK